MKRFLVTEAELSVNAVLASVASPEVGGIALFVGTVRDHNAGQPITRLEYQAYESMAEKELERLGAELEAEFPGVRVAAHHRHGSLEIGDIAVVCAAGAAHREQAFLACRGLIDRIKERVPIWKREHGPEGPYWVGWEAQNARPR